MSTLRTKPQRLDPLSVKKAQVLLKAATSLRTRIFGALVVNVKLTSAQPTAWGAAFAFCCWLALGYWTPSIICTGDSDILLLVFVVDLACRDEKCLNSPAVENATTTAVS